MPPIPEPPVTSYDDHVVVVDEETLLTFGDGSEQCYSDLLLSSGTNELLDSNDGEWDNNKSTNDKRHVCRGVWEWYCQEVEARPLWAKSWTAFVLLALADMLAQMVEHGRGVPYGEFIDWMRALRFGIFGLLGAPWTHYYYDILDTMLPPTPQPWTLTTAVKVIIDQFVQAPALLALIIMGMALMKGQGIDGMKQSMEDDYITTLIKNWQLWIPATVINIAFVKPSLRVLYDNIVFFVWTIFLSMVLNDNGGDPTV